MLYFTLFGFNFLTEMGLRYFVQKTIPNYAHSINVINSTELAPCNASDDELQYLSTHDK